MENNYEQRAVLFLDVLGFKRLIKENRQAVIHDVLEITSRKYDTNYQISAFSDNLAVSMKFNSGYELFNLIEFASYLTWLLLHKGVLCRGGIAVGDLYHRDGVIYGPALVRAYQLESQVAIYPRIVLDKEAFADSIRIGGNPSGYLDKVRSQLLTDSDGFEYVHLMGHGAMIPFDEMISYDSILPEHRIEFLIGEVRNEVQLGVKVATARKALASNPYSPADIRSAAKHGWMNKYVDYYENIYHHAPQWTPLPVAQFMLETIPKTSPIREAPIQKKSDS